jgi:hypothetical protein
VLGFPIRKSSDHSSVDSSPRLIAASYVLHRLLVPRHPPCALKNLATKMLASTVQFSNNNPNTNPTPPLTQQGQFDSRPARRKKQTRSVETPLARPLRTQQRTYDPPPTSNPFQLTPTKEWTTNTPQGTGDHVVLDITDQRSTELVSVPPMSSTAERTSTRGPEPSMHLRACVNSRHNQCGPVAP